MFRGFISSPNEFKNISEAKTYIKKQKWFEEGVKENIFKPSDAFYPVKIKGFFGIKKMSTSSFVAL